MQNVSFSHFHVIQAQSYQMALTVIFFLFIFSFWIPQEQGSHMCLE